MKKSEWSKKLKSNLLNNWRIRGISGEMIGNHLMCQSALLNMYLVDKQNNFATKIVSNITKFVENKSKSQQSKQQSNETVSLKLPNTPTQESHTIQ